MHRRSTQAKVISLFDIKDSLIDNDHVIADCRAYLERDIGAKWGRASSTMRGRNALV